MKNKIKIQKKKMNIFSICSGDGQRNKRGTRKEIRRDRM